MSDPHPASSREPAVVDNVVVADVNRATALSRVSTHTHGLNLFLTGFLVLFLELASIRWFGATVIFLQFFTNVVLLACFLGMSCGCMAARQSRDWLAAFPVLAVGAVIAACVVWTWYVIWNCLLIDLVYLI